MSHTMATGAGRITAFFRLFGSAEFVFGRVLPVFLCQLMLIPRLINLVDHILAGPGDRPPLTFWLGIFQSTLAATFLTFIVVLFLVRRTVVGQRSSLLGSIVALAGSFIINLPVSATLVDNPIALLLSSGLILVGMLWAVVSLAYLGRCFGVFPEARGLVTRGPYRWVRHPLYLGELVAAFGLVVATASPTVLGVFLALCGLQYWRARLEERALARAFPEYAEYSHRTYRILPGIH